MVTSSRSWSSEGRTAEMTFISKSGRYALFSGLAVSWQRRFTKRILLQEIFYQLVGDMTLIVQEHGELIHIPIREVREMRRKPSM